MKDLFMIYIMFAIAFLTGILWRPCANLVIGLFIEKIDNLFLKAFVVIVGTVLVPTIFAFLVLATGFHDRLLLVFMIGGAAAWKLWTKLAERNSD